LHVLKRWAAWPRGNRWLAGIAAVVLGLAIAWVLFVPLADWLAHHDVGSATGPLHETALDNARGRLLTLAAGLLAAGALVFTALNFRLLRRNSEQADQWQRRTHELTEQGQVTDRYTKAVEQLGSDKLDVRIGGIYALERVARDSPRDQPAVMDVLTTFIREHSWEPWPLPRTEEEEDADLVEFTRPDIQAALTVVGRRDSERDIGSIDLTRADLTRANLTRADLTDADLTGACLAGADLTSTYLTSADLTGANLAGACLDGAYFTDADLTGAYLASAHIVEAYLDWAHLTDADLTGASLAFADLSNTDLTSATLTDTDLDRADLTGSTWPADTPVPDGWDLDAGTGQLQRAATDPGPAEAN
jgi:Pentapeptide repeats (8 copies)